MEAVYYAARANLRRLLTQHPAWTRKQYAQAVGMSKGWVKKWVKRLQEAPPEEEAVLHSQSRARKHPPERISQVVVDRILQMRDQPPEGLGRTPGPKALLYYLPRDVELAATGQRLPRSSRTIYRLLRQAGRIQRRVPAQHEPLDASGPDEPVAIRLQRCLQRARPARRQAAARRRGAQHRRYGDLRPGLGPGAGGLHR